MNISKNYNRTLLAAFGAIILLLAIFFGIQFNRQLEQEVELIHGHFGRHFQLLEFGLRSSVGEVDALRMAAENFESTARAEGHSSAQQNLWPKQHQGQSHFTLDHLKDPDTSGNLIGFGGLQSDSQKREIKRALSLNTLTQAQIFNLPAAVRSVYTSVEYFHFVSPWVPSEQFKFDLDVYKQDTWQSALVNKNPYREKFWSQPIFAGRDIGLVAPVAAPVYEREKFRGAVRIDISLDYINRINSFFGYPLGYIFVVDANKNVIAHPKLYTDPLAIEKPPLLGSAWPNGLSHLNLEPGAMQEDTPIYGSDYVAIRRSFISAPWQLVYIVPKKDLIFRLLAAIWLPTTAMLLGLVSLLFIAHILTRRDFVRPAAQLVQHLSKLSRNDVSHAEKVPDVWQPWFKLTSQIFRESKQFAAVQQELKIAAELQRAILPTDWPRTSGFTLFGVMQPAKEVGGDFYDHFPISSNQYAICIADVSGKGVPAALFGMVCKTHLRGYSTQFQDGALTLSKTNSALVENNPTCMFVTANYVTLDTQKGVVTLINAGHPSPLLRSQSGSVVSLECLSNVALGVVEGYAYQSQSITLAMGDMLIFYTDGVTEAMNSENEEFGLERLINVLTTLSSPTPKQVIDAILKSVSEFVGKAEPHDDLTCIVLHFHSTESN